MTALFLATISTLTLNAFAGTVGASGYDCVGKNSVTKDSVVLELLFSNSAPEVGYANQTVTIKKVGAQVLDQPIVLQMFEATKRNECQKNQSGQTYMSGGIDLTPTKEGELADFTISFKSYCGDRDSKLNFDVKAYCVYQTN